MSRLLVVCALVVALIAMPSSVRAHADLDFTLPTDGAAVGEPVSEITVGFTEAVTLVGNGFEVLDPQGNLILPFAVTDDDQVFRLQLDPPLGGGAVGVAYEVTSLDGHVVAGSFSFTVSVPAPTTTIATTTTISATTTTVPSSTTTPVDIATTVAAATTTSGPTSTATSSSAAVTTVAPVTTAADDSGDGDSDSTWIFLGIAGIVIIGAAAFLLFRPKSSA